MKNNLKIFINLQKNKNWLHHNVDFKDISYKNELIIFFAYLIYFYKHIYATNHKNTINKAKLLSTIEETIKNLNDTALSKQWINIKNNSYNENEFNSITHKIFDIFVKQIDNYIKHDKQRQKTSEFFILLLIQLFFIDSLISKIDKKIINNLTNSKKYENNVFLIKKELTIIFQLQDVLMKWLPNSFNDSCVAINLLIKNHY